MPKISIFQKLERRIEKALEKKRKKKWGSLSSEQIWRELNSGPDGLSAAEAAKRFKIYGPNELPHKKGEPPYKIFLNQFRSLLMYIMFAAIIVAYFIEDRTSLIFISLVTLSNALVGFYQEYKADRSLQLLKHFVEFKTRVIRGGMEQQIHATRLVPGDVIILRPGDRVPADALLFEASGLKINESVLTGESRFVEKEIGKTAPMVFMGTAVEDGIGKGVVAETGIHTEYGDIIRQLEETPEEPTHLQKMMRSLSKTIAIFIGSTIGAILLLGYFRGIHPSELLTNALALFVSGIPEGLLPAVTIVLAVGINRILRQRGLARRLATVETLGAVTIICSDKTGTLTQGRMEVEKIITADNKKETERLALLAGVLSSDAYIENPHAQFDKLIIRGKPTERAVVKYGAANGLWKEELDKKYETSGTLFFSAERKYSATFRRAVSGETMLYALGAPEKIIERSSKITINGEIISIKNKEAKKFLKIFEELAEKGFHVMASAYRSLEKTKGKLDDKDVKNLILAGFIVFADPVRPSVKKALDQTNAAGIRTVIITGDHMSTAKIVAKKIGFNIKPEEAIEGKQIDGLNDAELKEKVSFIKLYARVSPYHKLRIVQAFQSRGEVVAMFGDGVNDAPALKAANVGVAVNPEIDAVKETADLVLLDSGFNTIVNAIEQGRVIFDNVRKIFLYLIMMDLSQFVVYFIALAAEWPLPVIAAQILFINLIESGLPDIALTSENEREGIMKKRPRPPSESVANKPAIKLIVSGLIISGAIAAAFYFFILNSTGDIELTRTIMTVYLCVESLVLALAMRSLEKPLFRKNIFANKLLTGAITLSFAIVIFSVYFTPLQNLVSLLPLSSPQWLIAVIVPILTIAAIDRFKLKFFASVL